MPSHDEVAGKLDEVEVELKFTQAFAMDTMPFAYWLQFVFIPRVRSIVEEKGTFPATSMVATQAIREFDDALFR
jgi:uncharacterized protein YqcC (DUF446 family)